MSEVPASRPRFSVVVPTYNQAQSILGTLDTLWQQSCRDFEVIVVDDGSTDDTAQLLASVDDPRLRVITQPNGGPARARNTGLDAASGHYIAWLDSDDRWFPDRLAEAQVYLDSHPRNSFIYSQIIVDRGFDRYWVKPGRAKLADESIFDYLFIHGGFLQTSTIIVETDTCRSIRWNEDVTYGDNDQYAIDLCLAGHEPVMLARPGTLYNDIFSDSALSQLPVFSGSSTKFTNFFTYVEGHRAQMSEAAQSGFDAHVKSMFLARRQPLVATRLIFRAWRTGAYSLKSVLRQLFQSFAPRAYRRTVDQYVRFRGQPLSALRPQDNN